MLFYKTLVVLAVLVAINTTVVSAKTDIIVGQKVANWAIVEKIFFDECNSRAIVFVIKDGYLQEAYQFDINNLKFIFDTLYDKPRIASKATKYITYRKENGHHIHLYLHNSASIFVKNKSVYNKISEDGCIEKKQASEH